MFNSINIDLIIFSSFLLMNLGVGLFYSGGIKNIKNYAIGDRNFTTSTLVSTIVASWIGAGFFTYTMSETYRQGLYFMIPVMAESLGLLIIGSVFVCRMGEFLGKISVPEIMGDLFGTPVRIITAVASIISYMCILAGQFKVSSQLLEVIFGTSSLYATLLSAAIAILYSARGGIKAVTFTDIIQFFTFVCVLPIIAITIFDGIKDKSALTNLLSTNELFSFSEVFNLSNPKFYRMLGIAVIFFPTIGPMLFQRISMARSVYQASTAFKISGAICFVMQMMIAFIGILLLSDNPNLDSDNLVSYVIHQYADPGFKGIFAIGIMAMIMSTADSFLNTISIIFAHDLCRPLGLSWSKNEVFISRMFSVIAGAGAVLLALCFTSILDLVILSVSVYESIAEVPLILAIFGFRSSGKSVLIAMICAVIVLLILEFKFIDLDVEGYIIAMLVNALALFSAHYLLKQPGGWVGIKDRKTFESYQLEKMKNRSAILNSILNFSFIEFCKKNLTKREEFFSYAGFVSLTIILINMFTIPNDSFLKTNNMFLIYQIALVCSNYFLLYPILPSILKGKTLTSIVWLVGLSYCLICIPTLFLIASGLAMIQSMLFVIAIILLLAIFDWKVAFSIILVGFYGTLLFIKIFLSDGLSNLGYEIQVITPLSIFGIILFGVILVMFLKPAQHNHQKTDKLFSAAGQKINNLSDEVRNLSSIKEEFLTYVTGAIRVPMNKISVGALELYKNWDKYSDQEKRDLAAMVYEGYKGANDHIEKFLDFSELNANKLDLTISEINFAQFAEEVIDEFKELQLENPDLKFALNVSLENPLVYCDRPKIKNVIISLLKNSARSMRDGVVDVKIKDIIHGDSKAVKFSVIDYGSGIDAKRLSMLFGPSINQEKIKEGCDNEWFDMAISEKIIAAHRGMIWAENNSSQQGATFYFIIPVGGDGKNLS